MENGNRLFSDAFDFCIVGITLVKFREKQSLIIEGADEPQTRAIIHFIELVLCIAGTRASSGNSRDLLDVQGETQRKRLCM